MILVQAIGTSILHSTSSGTTANARVVRRKRRDNRSSPLIHRQSPKGPDRNWKLCSSQYPNRDALGFIRLFFRPLLGSLPEDSQSEVLWADEAIFPIERINQLPILLPRSEPLISRSLNYSNYTQVRTLYVNQEQLRQPGS